MSTLAPPEGGSPPLDAVRRQAGAVFANHGGRAAAIHYGSAAGELSVCVSAVGLVDRSELTTLALQAPSAQLAALTSRLAGGGRRLVERLRAHAAHQVALRLLAVDFSAIGLLGPKAVGVLGALGVYGS